MNTQMELTPEQHATPAPGIARSLLALLQSLLGSVKIRRKERALHLCETLALGERRFLALVQCEGRKYLIGTTSSSVSLLDCLDSPARPHESTCGLRGSLPRGGE